MEVVQLHMQLSLVGLRFQQGPVNMKEPETVSTVAGSEVYQIPQILAKKHGIGLWFIGEEAERLALMQGEEAVSGLLQAALAGKEFFIEWET